MIASRPVGVLIAAFLATGCGTGQGVASTRPAAPSLAPAGAASPSHAAATPSTPGALPIGDLEVGVTYYLDEVIGGPQRLFVTVPASGWFSVDTWFLGKNDVGAELFSMTLLPYQVANVYADPCRWMSSALDPPVGLTVDDLAMALVKQAGPNGLPASEVAVGGYTGKKVELDIPIDLDTDACDERDFGRWSPKADPEHYGPFTYGKGQRDIVYIIDVDGTRWVIDTNYLPGTSAASLAELEQLVASIRFEK